MFWLGDIELTVGKRVLTLTVFCLGSRAYRFFFDMYLVHWYDSLLLRWSSTYPCNENLTKVSSSADIFFCWSSRLFSRFSKCLPQEVIMDPIFGTDGTISDSGIVWFFIIFSTDLLKSRSYSNSYESKSVCKVVSKSSLFSDSTHWNRNPQPIQTLLMH